MRPALTITIDFREQERLAITLGYYMPASRMLGRSALDTPFIIAQNNKAIEIFYRGVLRRLARLTLFNFR